MDSITPGINPAPAGVRRPLQDNPTTTDIRSSSAAEIFAQQYMQLVSDMSANTSSSLPLGLNSNATVYSVPCEALHCPNVGILLSPRCKTARFCSIECIRATWPELGTQSLRVVSLDQQQPTVALSTSLESQDSALAGASVLAGLQSGSMSTSRSSDEYGFEGDSSRDDRDSDIYANIYGSNTHHKLKRSLDDYEADQTNQNSTDQSPPNRKRFHAGKMHWTAEMDQTLREGVQLYGSHDWMKVAGHVGHDVNNAQCLVRWVRHLDPALAERRMGPWTEEEVQRMNDLVPQYTTEGGRGGKATVDWEAISNALNRTYKDCQDRWYNIQQSVRRAQLRRGPYTAEEDALILRRRVEWELAGSVRGKLWPPLEREMGRSADNISKRYEQLMKRAENGGGRSARKQMQHQQLQQQLQQHVNELKSQQDKKQLVQQQLQQYEQQQQQKHQVPNGEPPKTKEQTLMIKHLMQKIEDR